MWSIGVGRERLVASQSQVDLGVDRGLLDVSMAEMNNTNKDFTSTDFISALADGAYAWPGGYPKYFVTSDGEALSFQGAKDNGEQIAESIDSGANDGWRVVGMNINWECPDMYCCHRNERIESAYAEDQGCEDEMTRQSRGG